MPLGMASNLLLAPALIVLIVVIALLELVLKGFALWRSARRNELAWFLILLLFNTAGILPALYLAFFSGPRGGVASRASPRASKPAAAPRTRSRTRSTKR